jgi:phage-related baseplate assembly protein
MTTPRFPVVDPSQFPVLTVVELPDEDAVLSARMAEFKARWVAHDPPMAAQYDVDVLEFDPVVINQETNTAFEIALVSRLNAYARATTLAFAWGDNLDAIASRYPGGVARLATEKYTDDSSPLEKTVKDNAYRRRIWLAPNTLAASGTAESYEFWTRTVDGDLRDVTVINPREGRPVAGIEPGTIIITMMANGTDPAPSRERILAVRTFLMRPEIKPLTDVIVTVAPRVKSIDYRLRWWKFPNANKVTAAQGLAERIAAHVEASRYLGVDHSHLDISAAAKGYGISGLDIVSPAADVFVDPTELARVSSVRLDYAGERE